MKKWFLLTLLLGLPLAAEPISLVLKEAPTAEVLSYLAEETQQNMVIDPRARDFLSFTQT